MNSHTLAVSSQRDNQSSDADGTVHLKTFQYFEGTLRQTSALTAQ